MKIGVIICTYNRPNYLKECFESLSRSDIPKESILIVDDCSTDEQTKIILIGSGHSIMRKQSRSGIKDSLLRGYAHWFNDGCDFVINLDGDSIISNNFLQTILKLKNKFPDNIVSGFNTTVKNRNPIIEEHKDFFFKRYASGINMCINKDQYEKYVMPSLKKAIGNWDYDSSKLHEADDKHVIVSKPSVVQHIGIESSMGHATSEPPDVAEDFKPLHLPMVTLVGVSGNDYENLLKSAEISMKYIQFGAVKMLHLPQLDSKAAYNKFVLKELVNYIETPYFLIIQPDSYVLNYKAWTNEFLNFDVVGGWWSWYSDGEGCANGGFALRSTKLHKILMDDITIVSKNDDIIKNKEEDHLIGRVYRKYLEDCYSIKFAPKEICQKFSIEAWSVKPPHNKYNGSFGFHSVWVDFNDANLEYIPYRYPNHGRKINYNPSR